jgi:hypothetical protein
MLMSYVDGLDQENSFPPIDASCPYPLSEESGVAHDYS